MNSEQIPINLELTELLPIINNEISQPPSIDLSVDIFANGTDILKAINKLPLLNLQIWTLAQDLEGYLKLDVDNLRFAAYPWKVSHTMDEAIVQADAAQTVQFITTNGIKVIAQPAVQNPKALETALQKLDLTEFTIQYSGNMKIVASDTIWYSARPNLASFEVDKDSAIGLFVNTLPAFLVFEDETGKKRQQSFYPAPADIEALHLAAQQVELNQGILSFQLLEKNYQGMLDYEIFQGDKTGSLKVSPILQENGDESGNYLLNYLNGAAQKLFALSTI